MMLELVSICQSCKKRFDDYIKLLKDSQFSNLRMQCEGFIEKIIHKGLFDYFNIFTVHNLEIRYNYRQVICFLKKIMTQKITSINIEKF